MTYHFGTNADASERYKYDPVFHTLVDTMRAILESDKGDSITPSDVRAAALLAATMHEYERIRPIIVHPGERWLPDDPSHGMKR